VGQNLMILTGDVIERLSTIEAESFDAVLCDPPYHLTTEKKGGSGPASTRD
jgi:tRNA1(Val) A37 N6-methylase TrmN6